MNQFNSKFIIAPKPVPQKINLRTGNVKPPSPTPTFQYEPVYQLATPKLFVPPLDTESSHVKTDGNKKKVNSDQIEKSRYGNEITNIPTLLEKMPVDIEDKIAAVKTIAPGVNEAEILKVLTDFKFNVNETMTYFFNSDNEWKEIKVKKVKAENAQNSGSKKKVSPKKSQHQIKAQQSYKTNENNLQSGDIEKELVSENERARISIFLGMNRNVIYRPALEYNIYHTKCRPYICEWLEIINKLSKFNIEIIFYTSMTEKHADQIIRMKLTQDPYTLIHSLPEKELNGNYFYASNMDFIFNRIKNTADNGKNYLLIDSVKNKFDMDQVFIPPELTEKFHKFMVPSFEGEKEDTIYNALITVFTSVNNDPLLNKENALEKLVSSIEDYLLKNS